MSCVGGEVEGDKQVNEGTTCFQMDEMELAAYRKLSKEQDLKFVGPGAEKDSRDAKSPAELSRRTLREVRSSRVKFLLRNLAVSSIKCLSVI